MICDLYDKIQELIYTSSMDREKPKERKTKRPSVAARKAKANLVKQSDLPKQAGMKRKVDSRTPDSTLRNRKVKKNR